MNASFVVNNLDNLDDEDDFESGGSDLDVAGNVQGTH